MAGYLFGIAAECAVKAMMQDAGIALRSDKSRRDDPYFAHFPELRTLLRDNAQTRKSSSLMRIIGNDAFMRQWSTDMRYAPGSDIDSSWVDDWAQQSREVVGLIGAG